MISMCKSVNNVYMQEDKAHLIKIALYFHKAKMNKDTFQTSTNTSTTFQYIPVIKDSHKPFLFTWVDLFTILKQIAT